MANNIVRLPADFYGKPNQDRPIFNGSVYIGNPDTDGEIESNRKTVILKQEDGTEVTIAPEGQPLKTGSGGYIMYNGNVVKVLTDGNHSLKVLDSQGNQEFYFENVLDGEPVTEGSELIINVYENVAALVTSSLNEGVLVRTKGYYTAGDSGAAVYLISASQTVDGYGSHTLSNGNTAILQYGDEVILEQFGVDGSASATDANAWQAAVDFCTGAEAIQLKATSGKTYLFDPNNNKPGVVGAAILVTPKDGESFFFDGANSTFKFIDNMPNTAGTFWHQILVFMGTTAGITNQDAEQVIFDNMVIDGNYRGQPAPTGISDYEQRAALKVLVIAGDGNRLKLAKFRNIVQIDPMADTLFIGPADGSMTSDNESSINNVVIDTFHAGARNSARSAIQLSSGAGRIDISNITRDKVPGTESNSIETEFTQIADQKVTVNITNCFIDDLEFGGILGKEDQFQVNLTNCELPDDGFFLMARGNVKAVNCRWPFSSTNAQRYKRAEFTQCIFVHNVYDDSGTQDVRSLNLLPEDTANTKSVWIESHCEHVISGTPSVGANNAAISGSVIAASDHLNHEIRLDNVIFDVAFPRSVQGYRSGFLNTNNCNFAGSDWGVQCGSDATFTGSWTSKDDDFSKVSGDNFNFLANGTTAEVRILGGVWDTLTFAGANVTNISAGLVQSSRVIQSAAAPAGGGAIGDIVKLDSAAYAAAASTDPVAWSCVSAHPTAATFLPTLNKP